ncbi:transcriptional repressor p66-beta isoform X2 [Cylas formicarius]|uniref:transcriptional repressor p66-beta isoform X2 n=1 Tax=Cylas formicarius TaxID=197179 RepID=UPI0029587984|nr:transcriptional repressor p66-beta isoform X2 [Cylas formicarius]
MENNMEVDEAVVDLSIGSFNRTSPALNPAAPRPPTTTPSHADLIQLPQPALAAAMVNSRRVLRPRTEPRSYVESPDAIINGTFGGKRTNGLGIDYGGESDSSDGEMPPLPPPIKELTPAEIKQRERGLRRLREELRAEEMKLVLLKKLKQSQQLKENMAVQLPPGVPPSALPPAGLPSGLSITPTVVKVPPANAKGQSPQTAHTRHGSTPGLHPKSSPGGVPSLMRGQLAAPRTTIHPPQITATPIGSGRAANLSVPQPPQRSSMGRPPSGFPPGVKDLSPSVTITPAPPQSVKPVSVDNKPMGGNMQQNIMPEDRTREDNQTPAQRQAAAKLALRKQLEKTLLQIPPPKPPPPEMHFIPNPSNTEFIYLVGLEHVVDFLTKETKMPLPPAPFLCSQCNSDFTPVWKWESKGKSKGLRVICEQCVTNNVKKALKAEHTNRLKTAFVKALQQEQEIEQRLAQNGTIFSTSGSPAQSPVSSELAPKSVTPTPAPRHAVTPPAPPPPQPTPPPPPPPRASHAPPSVQDKYSSAQSAAAVQALQQQLLRSLSSGAPPAHLMQFSPLFYPYQLAMAQAQAAANSGKGGSTSNLAEQMQRAADLQRQYLLDMIPPAPGQRHNWKT